jgi:hypothetical protein
MVPCDCRAAASTSETAASIVGTNTTRNTRRFGVTYGFIKQAQHHEKAGSIVLPAFVGFADAA